MESIPPSYEAATSRDPWQIIAPYIPSAELCALNRVSKALHCVFAPYLWGNPASHFGTENDRVYVGLTRFKRTLKRVRPEVRELTHTLHLPPAEAEIYDGPHPEWLRDVLEQLPNLQSLIVSRLPFFDHSALLALRTNSIVRHRSLQDQCPKWALRLLVAPYCQNTTSQGLSEALDHFPNLTYLDLSSTLAARDRAVLSKLHNLLLIQVVKLRNVHLRDEDLTVLAEALGKRVRVLCLQENHLTDRSVRTLLDKCFEPMDQRSSSPGGRSRASSHLTVEDWPSGIERPDAALIDEFRRVSYDDRLLRKLTTNVVSRLPFEDLPTSGITHLYIAENDVTVDGVAALVRSKSLRVLDVGSITDSSPVPTSGTEKLTPILERFAQSMTSLRIDYSIVVESAPPIKKKEPPTTVCELSGREARAELEPFMPLTHELESISPPMYELDSHELVPRYELAGEMNQPTACPPRDRNKDSTEECQLGVRRGGVFAPEVVEVDDGLEDHSAPVLTATGLGFMAQAVNGINSSTASPSYMPNSNRLTGDMSLNIFLIEQQRTELRSRLANKPHGLLAGLLPKLRTITLTDVPCYDTSRKIVDALIGFIENCATEAKLADQQARLRHRPVGSLGQAHINHHEHSAREIFALQRIVLEMAPADPLSAALHRAPLLHKLSKFVYRTKSSTEDADSEALWSASEKDFTFFDDDEECGLPAAETLSHIAVVAPTEKMTISNASSPRRVLSVPKQAPKNAHVDVVQELAKFRKDRKAAFEAASQRGIRHVEGYWPGEVKVVRDHGLGRATDYYGNYFDKGIYR